MNWTSSQRLAIDTVDGHVMVTAAAGSGKTAVLAERCAHLVADFPKDRRVDLDQLLVVTFTDAAAAEMRQRVGRFLRERIDANPHDGHLARQLVQLDAAAISTLHAFCLQTLRRWFTHADVDPTATLMDEDEADVLRHDVLGEVLKRRYADSGSNGQHFRRFVLDYSGGQDDGVVRIVLQLHGFLQSIVNPDEWCRAAAAPAPPADQLIETLREGLTVELAMQADWAHQMAARFGERGELGRFYAQRFAHAAKFLQDAHVRLRSGSQWEPVLESLRTFKAMQLRGKKDLIVSPEDEAFDRLGDALFTKLRRTLFKKRIVERYTSFDPEAAVADLSGVAEPKSVLLTLVQDFDEAYTQAKRDAHQLDFADLERMTLRLLTGDDSAARDDLRRRFPYVLVDEFQDINPVQSAILDAIAPPHPDGNLFFVGDAKQSIYRFRLAAPEIFRDRLDALERDSAAGTCIPLQENFRSRPDLLEGLNAMFRRTMVPGFGRMRYESQDELRAPAETPYQDFPHDDPPIEIHLLDKVARPVGSDEDGGDDDHELSVADLEASVREAHLIAWRIQDLVGRFPVLDRDPEDPDGMKLRPAAYRDICILLRSAKGRAEEIKQVLEAHDVPVVTESTTGFFEATEIRDILALLNLLDNRRQDIPLAAVLRSPLFGDPFDETDLAKLRVYNKSVTFHEAVFEYADNGGEDELRCRVAGVLRRLADYRHRLRHHCLADVLWQIYKRDGYLAYVGGLRDGRLRRANLFTLHERARAFGSFTRQGLRRFLRYIDGLRAADRDLGVASVTADQNVVRITTIHKSKGLEFPIVILSHAGKPFNEEDTRGSILFDRHVGVGLKVVRSDAKIEYPTADHHRAADRIRLANRAEELRLLYVAATRARENLIIIGTCPLETLDQIDLQFSGWSGPLPDLTLQTASHYLDWILPCLAADGDRVKTAKSPTGEGALFDLRTYGVEDLADWPVEPAGKKRDMPLFQRIAALKPLPRDEPRKASPVVDTLFRRLQFQYPAEPLVALPAMVAAGEVKRRLDLLVEPGESAHCIRPEPSARQPEDARQRGIAVHRLLQLVDLNGPCDLDALSRMRDRLVEERRITAEEANLIDLDAVVWFFATNWGQRLRTEAGSVHREAMFTIAQPPSLIAPNVESSDPADDLLVRGIIDVVLVGPDELDILDYKTDQIAADRAAERAETYRTQIDIYTTAAQTIWKRPVRGRALVFLSARRIVSC